MAVDGRARASVRRRLLGPAVVVAVVVLTACSPSAGPTVTSAGAAPPDAQSAPGAGPAAVGADALESQTLDGQPFSWSRLAGRPAALWFWAPWCTICRAEAPEVAEVAAEYTGRVEVIGVAGRGDRTSMEAFVADTGTGSLTHLVDEDGELWSRFGIVSQPAFVFVDPSEDVETFAGSLGEAELRAVLDDLASGS
ncbi:redoxin domain-containing protein [Blastococcus mobilis]|uniref:Thiol-disulfide isomerase or thioredoxin n=1 Tax=Blastococcus mobilis TaxID=1938746 RepID=A0A239A966_9ACTN|nr:redoxin domain-containing protein [Blastococcus mobilis]SNR92110.1 Thiol-disulfide isomerase or thioredoxin [Blastococcus mobilis]